MASQVSVGPGEMQVTVASYPPLGQVTKLATPNVKFSCVLHVETLHAGESWQVLLRFALIASDEWEEVDLKPAKGSFFTTCRQPNVGKTQLLFQGEICISATIRFELRFRRAHDGPWVTAQEDPGLDSIVVLALETAGRGKSPNLNDYMQDINSDLRSRFVGGGSKPGISSWIVEAPVEAAQGGVPHMTQVMFGNPSGGDFLRWFAVSRNTTSWMAPRQGRTYFKLDVAAILCSFLNSQGEHLMFLGISGFEDVMTIFGDNNEGSMMIKMRNDREAPGTGIVIVAIGDEFEATLESALSQARAIFGSTGGPKHPLDRYGSKSRDRRWAAQWLNGLIYTPTNDDGKQSEDDIIDSLSTLAAKGITVSGLMLSDVWQNIDQNAPSRYHAGLLDFEANPAFSKSGLKQAVANIKSQHKSVINIMVSSPIFGHWGGISENAGGSITQMYETIRVRRSEAIQPGPKTELTLSLVSPKDVQRFLSDYYRFLSSCDISAVQNDGVYMLETLTSAAERCSLTGSYLDAQSRASMEYFPHGTLTSTSLSPSALFSSLKLSRGHAEVVRNIGVFPDHGKYVFNNASNALLSGSIGNIPDWGPVQSTRDHGDFHAAARSISGGPIQIASFDNSVSADIDLVNQVTGQTAQGKTIVLRPTGIGRVTDPYIGFGDMVLLKIANRHEAGASIIHILGIFNTSDRTISELVQIRDFRGTDPAKEYVIKSCSGLVDPHVEHGGPALISVNLEPSNHEFLSAYPVTTLESAQGQESVQVATLGLRGKMLGATAILDSASSSSIEDGALRLRAVLKAFGTLEFYISDLPRRRINKNTLKIKFLGRELDYNTRTIKATGRVLAIDMTAIWEEHKTEGRVDEIDVEVTLAID